MSERWKNLCFYCGHELGWDSVDDSREDIVVNFLSCPYCGAFYEAAECPDEDKENYEFWIERYKDEEGK